MKRKRSNARKVPLPHFQELQENFLADIRAEVVMNEIPAELIFNWDQTALHLIATSQWTMHGIMHRAGEKIITVKNSDDKRQVTAVLAASLTGEFLAPQIIYKGKTERSHPKVAVPTGWDIWHSNHWSNEETMKRYVEKIIVPFLDEKRAALNLDMTYPALAIFACFRGQTTLEFYSLLEKHNIIFVQVPANCTDKLQPLDIYLHKQANQGRAQEELSFMVRQ